MRNATAETLPVRSIKLELHRSCRALVVPGGPEGYERLLATGHRINASTVLLSLRAGAGALLSLSGAGCEAAVASVRRWRFNPRAMSIKGGGQIQESGKAATYSRFGAGRRHYAPGGPAGWESNFILGLL